VWRIAVTNEVSGTGYTAGGNTLTISANPASSGTTAFLDFADTDLVYSDYYCSRRA
jgi:hypothetical protein